jgi:hypothetical protein
MRFTIRVRDLDFVFYGCGDPNLELTDSAEIVFRRSDYLSPRTIALRCNAAANDLPRGMISHLQNPNTVGILQIDALNEWRTPFLEIPRIEFEYNSQDSL